MLVCGWACPARPGSDHGFETLGLGRSLVSEVNWLRGPSRPSALVVAGEASAEDFEQALEVGGRVGSVDDGEGAGAEGGVDLAAVVAVGAASLDDDGGRRLIEAAEDFEEARAAFAGVGGIGGGIEREAEVDDGHVDGVLADDLRGLAAGLGAEGGDAHGFEEPGEAVGPGVVVPAGVGQEEVEAAGGLAGGFGVLARGRARARLGLVGGLGVEAHVEHGCQWASGVPELERGLAGLVGGWTAGAGRSERAGDREGADGGGRDVNVAGRNRLRGVRGFG